MQRLLFGPQLLAAALLAGSLALPAATAQAQATVSIGPQLGLNVAGVTNAAPTNITLAYRLGFEAGVQSVIQMGHLAVEPSLRFSQKGVRRRYGHSSGSTQTDYRINYLTLPVSVAYCLRSDGQGLQVFAGPYVGLLVGGNYQFTSSSSSSSAYEGSIRAGDYYTVPAPGTTTVDVLLRRFDAGLQAGLGYRVGRLLAQLNFSFGLTDLAPEFRSAYNRTAQASLSYLLRAKH